MTRVSRKQVVAAIAVGLVVVLGTGTAFAFWSVTSSGSGNAKTDTLAAPVQTDPTNVTSSGAQINWTAVATGWQASAIYTATVDAGSQTCSAAANVGKCSLSGLTSGTPYVVTLTATFSSWTSAASNTKTVTPTASDTTAPSSTITFPASAAAYNAAGWTAGCNVTPFNATNMICGTATDNVGGSGVKSVAVSVQATSGANVNKYWDPAATGGAGFKNASEVKMAATFSSGNWTLAFPAANLTDATYTVRVYATDNSNNTQAAATANSFTYDTTAPTGIVTVPANNASNLSGTQTVTATAADTGGSGVASVQFQYKAAAASTYTNIGSPVTSSPYSTSWTIQGLPNGNYSVQAIVTDKAGNTTTTSANAVSIAQAVSVPPSTADVGGAGAAAGKVNAGDKIVLNFPSNHPPTFSTVCSTWTSSSQPSITNATVTFSDGVGTTDDTMSSVSSSTCTLNLGTLDLGSSSYLQDGTGNGTLVFTSSTVSWSNSAKTVTITLGTLASGGSTTQTVASSVVTWTPSPSMQDGGNPTSFDYAVSASSNARQF